MDLEETVAPISIESVKEGWSSTEDLLSTVEDLAPQYSGKQEDLDFLKQFIRSKEFQHLMNIHDKVQDVSTTNEHCQPLTLLHMVLYDLEESTSKECEELYKHLNSVHVHGAVVAYDKIVNRDYLPIPSNPDEFKKQETSDPIMIVRVDKQQNEPLGITVKSDTAGNILISRVIHGTVADRCGLLRIGDVIHEINGYSIHGKDIDDIADQMSTLCGTIVFKVSSKQEYSQPQSRHQPHTFMRALFNYNPLTDSDLPCTEAGIGFKKGDVLMVLNQDDPHWWQAKPIDTPTKVGLIPSSRMRERWEYRNTLSDTYTRRRTKTKQVEYSPLDCEEQGGQEITTYEEVVEIEPQTLHPRPIVLIAPNCQPFAMAEVKSKLITSNPNKYGEPILTTTRMPKENEHEDERFHFVSKEEFMRSLQSKQVIDYVEYEGDYYGTYINTIRNTMASGRTCILTFRPKVLKIVHQMAEIKPYVIFFTPPKNPLIWTNDGTAQLTHYERAQQEMKEMESKYGQYFDKRIVYSNAERAFIEVQRTTEELTSHSQWVPAIWTA